MPESNEKRKTHSTVHLGSMIFRFVLSFSFVNSLLFFLFFFVGFLHSSDWVTQVNCFVAHSHIIDYRTQFTCIHETKTDSFRDKIHRKRNERSGEKKKKKKKRFPAIYWITFWYSLMASGAHSHGSICTIFFFFKYVIEAKSPFDFAVYFVTARRQQQSRSHYPVAVAVIVVVCVRETWMLFYERLASVLTMLVRGSGLTGCSFSFAPFDLCAALRCWSLVCLIFFFFLFLLSVHSARVYSKIVFDATLKSRVRSPHTFPSTHTNDSYFISNNNNNKNNKMIHNMCAARIFASFVNDKTDNV